MIQGSQEWIDARLGKATASRTADICATLKSGGWGASRATYKAELVSERLTGKPAPRYVNGAMEHGTATEPEARLAYEFMTNETVEEVGFIPHPRLSMSGASPDGMVGNHGLVEIKCPNTAGHIETLLGKNVPGKYHHQIQWQLACTNRQWCDFVSYDPRMPPSMRLFAQRIQRDERLIIAMEKIVSDFLDEVAETVANLTALYETADTSSALAAGAPLTVPAPAASL